MHGCNENEEDDNEKAWFSNHTNAISITLHIAICKTIETIIYIYTTICREN